MKWPQWLSKEKWRLVKTITRGVKVRESEQSGEFYFHLFESNKGNRKLEVGHTFSFHSSQNMFIAKQLDVYHETVYRWLKGRYDPSIPSYHSAPEEDTINALKGSI